MVKLSWDGVKHVDGGFVRDGASSFVNAALQCLFHVPAFVSFLDGDGIHNGGCKARVNCISCSLQGLLEEIRQSRIADPVSFLSQWREFCVGQTAAKRNDPFEFIISILLKLRLEYMENFECTTLSFEVLHATPTGLMFEGFKCFEVFCTDCGAMSKCKRPFLHVTVLENHGKPFEKNVLESLSNPEALLCGECSEPTLASAPNSFEFPPYLLMKLTRSTSTHNNQSLHPSFVINGTKYSVICCITQENDSKENPAQCICVAMRDNGLFKTFEDTLIMNMSLGRLLTCDQVKRSTLTLVYRKEEDNVNKNIARKKLSFPEVPMQRRRFIVHNQLEKSTAGHTDDLPGVSEDDISSTSFSYVEPGTILTKKELRSVATQTTIVEFEDAAVQVSEPPVSYELCKHHKKFQFFTGVSTKDFEILFRLLGGQECIELLKHKYKLNTPEKKVKSRLSAQEQLFMFLLRFRRGLALEELAYVFGISVSHAAEICYTLTRHTSLTFKSMQKACFPTAAEQRLWKPYVMMPFKTLRIIIDGALFRIQTPSNFHQQGNTFSNYKKTNAVLFIIGVSCAGGTIFCSSGFESSMSDKAAVLQSELLDLLDEGDTVMADRGFSMIAEFQAKKIHLIKPPVVGDRESLTAEEEILTKAIASARIYVEHAIADIKDNKILQGDIPLTLLPVLPDLVLIGAYMRNFKPSRIRTKCVGKVTSDAIKASVD